MDKVKCDAALAALEELARDELGADRRGRHARAIRVLQLAEQLSRLSARRVAEVADEALAMGENDNELDDGIRIGRAGAFGMQGRRVGGFATPGEDLVRVLADELPKIIAAQHAVPLDRQLTGLLDLRERLARPEDAALRAKLEARIAQVGDLVTATSVLAGAAPAADRRQISLSLPARGGNGAAHAVDAVFLDPDDDADEEDVG